MSYITKELKKKKNGDFQGFDSLVHAHDPKTSDLCPALLIF